VLVGALLSDALDEQLAFGKPDLAVELPKERETEKAVDAPPLRQVVGVDLKFGDLEPEARESLDPKQIALLAPDR
jgi:hypothetical protein